MTTKGGTTKPSQLMSDVAWFLKNFTYQLDDLDQVEHGFSLAFYWDTSDVRRAALGMMDFYTNSGNFDNTKFDEPATLVCCLAADGWLGPMKLLRPHQAELSNALTSEFNLTSDPVRPESADEFFRHVGLRNLTNLAITNFHQKSVEERNEIVAQYAGQAETFFKAVQSVHGNWRERLASMYRRSLIDLVPEDDGDYLSIFEGEDFRRFRRFFDDSRPAPKKHIPNFSDAAALCLLQRKVSQFKQHKVSVLPRFFESSPLFRQAAESLDALDSLSYSSKYGERIPILRDADYYIFRATFNPPAYLAAKGAKEVRRDSLESVRHRLKEIEDASEPLTPEVINGIDVDGRSLHSVITELKQYSFLAKVWLRYAAGDTLARVSNDYVRCLIDIRDDEAFRKSVHSALAEVSLALDKAAHEYKSVSDLWRKLESHIEQVLAKDHRSVTRTLDAFSFHGLIRFGVPFRYHARIAEVLGGLRASEEEDGGWAMTEIFRAISETLRVRQDEEATAVAMCSLWVLEMDYLISAIHLDIPRERSWLIAIAAASDIRSKRHHALDRSLKELRHRSDQAADPSERAEIAILLAYLNYHLWRESGGEIQWRNDRHVQATVSEEELKAQVDSAISFARIAYDAKHTETLTRVYAVNIYLYYVTEGAPDSVFRAVFPLADELMHVDNRSVWQYRFDDTLARFFHRRCVMASTREEKLSKLRQAKVHAALAVEQSQGDPFVIAYQGILENVEI